MRGSWHLTQEEKDKYVPFIKESIKKLKAGEENIDLTKTELTPNDVGDILEELGYDRISFETNGWEMDFWIEYGKFEEKKLIVSGCGMTFDLIMRFTDE